MVVRTKRHLAEIWWIFMARIHFGLFLWRVDRRRAKNGTKTANIETIFYHHIDIGETHVPTVQTEMRFNPTSWASVQGVIVFDKISISSEGIFVSPMSRSGRTQPPQVGLGLVRNFTILFFFYLNVKLLMFLNSNAYFILN